MLYPHYFVHYHPFLPLQNELYDACLQAVQRHEAVQARGIANCGCLAVLHEDELGETEQVSLFDLSAPTLMPTAPR